MCIENIEERQFYEIEAVKNNWSLRELNRQFDSALYERLALSTDKEKISQLSKEGQDQNEKRIDSGRRSYARHVYCGCDGRTDGASD